MEPTERIVIMTHVDGESLTPGIRVTYIATSDRKETRNNRDRALRVAAKEYRNKHKSNQG